MAIVPKAKGDEEKISAGLAKLMEEDPTFKVENNKETKQTVISGTGDQHLAIITSKLTSKFGVGVDLIAPKIAYREAIKKKVKVEGKHKNNQAVTVSTATFGLSLSLARATVWYLKKRYSAEACRKLLPRS